MGRTRDIAAILGKTEITNSQNKRVLTVNDDGFVDSAYVSTISVANRLSYYSTVDSLPSSSLTAGDQAFVADSNKLYISDGSIWNGIVMIDSLG